MSVEPLRPVPVCARPTAVTLILSKDNHWAAFVTEFRADIEEMLAKLST